MSTPQSPALTPLHKTGWILSILLPVLLFFSLRGTGGLTPEMAGFFALTIWAITCWATEILPPPLVAVMLPIFYFSSGILPEQEAARVALASPFATVIPWAVIGALLIGLITQKTGLARRIVLRCIMLTGSTYPGFFFALFLSGLILTPLVPSATVKVAIMLALGVGACEALGLEKGSRDASVVMVAAFLAITAPRFGILTGTLENMIITSQMALVSDIQVSYLDYARHMFVPAMLYSAMSMGLALLMVRSRGRLDKEALARQYKEMGPISREEIIAGVLAVAAVALAAVNARSGMHLFVVVAALAFLPGLRILDSSDLGKIAWPMVFFIAGTLTIGAVANKVGVAAWMAEAMLPIAQKLDSVGGLSLFAYGSAVGMNFVLTQLAAQSLMIAPFTELALSIGMEPYPLAYSFLLGADQYVFAYEFPLLLLFTSTGHLRMNHCVLLLFARMLLGAPFILGIALPYWKLIGIA
jgi:di/tricarboxylate transporter